jgi:hypothetical protein
VIVVEVVGVVLLDVELVVDDVLVLVVVVVVVVGTQVSDSVTWERSRVDSAGTAATSAASRSCWLVAPVGTEMPW